MVHAHAQDYENGFAPPAFRGPSAALAVKPYRRYRSITKPARQDARVPLSQQSMRRSVRTEAHGNVMDLYPLCTAYLDALPGATAASPHPPFRGDG